MLINDFECRPLRFVPPEKRNVGLMFQDFALFPHLTIRDNVAFGLKSCPGRRRPARPWRRCPGGLERYADDYPTSSRAASSSASPWRAIVPRRRHADGQPLSFGCAAARAHAGGDAAAPARDAGHVPDRHARTTEAIRLGDRIAVMRRGRLVQAGKAEDLYRNPADLFTARLFSEINEIPVSVEGGALRTPIGTFVVPELSDGDEAILCIRRRAIRLAPPGQGLPGRVVRIKFLGDQAVLEIAAPGFERAL